MKKLLTIALLCFAGLALAEDVTLTWTPPTENVDGTPYTDGDGFYIKYGNTDGGPYPTVIRSEESTDTSWVVTGLSEGTYYFVVTAYNEQEVESDNSNQAMKTILPNRPVPPGNLAVGDSNLIVYTPVWQPDKVILVPVGDVPAGTACDPEYSVNGHYVVPTALVNWAQSSSFPAVFAECS